MNIEKSFESNLWISLEPEIEQFFAALQSRNPNIHCFLQYPSRTNHSNFSGAGAAFLNPVGSTREARGDGVSLSISYSFDDSNSMNIDCFFSWNETGRMVAEKIIIVKADGDSLIKTAAEQVGIFLHDSIEALLEAMN